MSKIKTLANVQAFDSLIDWPGTDAPASAAVRNQAETPIVGRIGDKTVVAFGSRLNIGGDEGDRTLNLRLAKPALSQLSYVPKAKDEIGWMNHPSAFSLGTNGDTWIRTKDLSFIRAAL